MANVEPGFIRFIKPVIPPPEEWAPYLQESYEIGYYTNTGPAVKQFERRLQEKYGRGRAAVTAPNATNALVAALQALDVTGKVLTPSYTFPATAQAILMAGAEPLFCDIAADTWELDPAVATRMLERERVGAILHLRPYGISRDAAPFETLARKHGIPLVIDSAAALGATASTEGFVGQQGDVEVFSLHATKVFAIGEGGLSLMRAGLEQRFRQVSNFGISYPDILARGQNSKMSDFQAAVGLAMLRHIDAHVAQRHRTAANYYRRLSTTPGVQQALHPDLAPWQCYPVLLAKDAEAVVEACLEQGLELKRGYYQPLHQTSHFGRYAGAALPVTEDLGSRMVLLPVYSDMSLELSDAVLARFIRALVT